MALRHILHRPPALGLDISDRSVKFIELRRGRSGFAVRSFGEIAVPSGVIEDGEIRDSEGLERLLSGLGIGARPVVASLPDEQGFIRRIELPAVCGGDVAHAVRWELEGLLSLPLHAVSYDYHSTPNKRAVHENALVVAYPCAISDSYRRVLTAAGFTPIALEPESQAMLRAVLPERSDGSCLVADIGEVRTSLIAAAGGTMRSVTSIPLGGRDIEAAITRGLGVSPSKARAIKIDAGIDGARHGGRVREAFQPLLERLAAAASDVLESLPQDADVRLSGGDANLIGLAKYLGLALRRPVRPADPFANAGLAPGAIPPISQTEALRYAVAIGLALRVGG